MAEIIQHESGFDAYVHDGEPRLLACLPTHPDVRARFKSFSSANPLVPRSQWAPIDRRPQFDSTYILNQRSHGSCTGFGSAGALMRARALSGQAFQTLSGSFTYSYVNGGRDQGASIGDTLDSLMQHGTCTDAECGWDMIYTRQIPDSARQTALRFKIDEGYRIDTYDEAGSATQLGFTLVYAVMVGRTFDNLDSDDIVGLDRGPGNHCVHAYGLKQSKSGLWILDSANSWDVTWGNQGRFCVTEQHWNGVQMDAYAIRVSSFDPNNPSQPPVAAA